MVFDNETGKAIGYSQEERSEALEVSLTSLASSMDYTVVKFGRRHSLKEMDSIVIYNDRTWRRWSNNGSITGGTQIDFLMAFGNASTAAEAIYQLLSFKHSNIVTCCRPTEEKPERDSCREMVLPPRNNDYKRLFAYLIKTRGLSQEVIVDFIHKGLIYEDRDHHNIVFLGYDPQNVIRYAGLRGTADIYGKKFKMDLPGNDKNYGVNIVNKESSRLLVFESVIDCMSYIDLYQDNVSNKLVLGMVEDNPLEQFLKDYNHISVIDFCLDNDKAGKTALYGRKDESGKLTKAGLIEKYESRGYEVNVKVPEYGKDWNETLLHKKEMQISVNNQENNIKRIGRGR